MSLGEIIQEVLCHVRCDRIRWQAVSCVPGGRYLCGKAGPGSGQQGQLRRADAKVEGKVLAQVKGEKIIIYKYKSKKNYHRKAGHRQAYTKVEITAVG